MRPEQLGQLGAMLSGALAEGKARVEMVRAAGYPLHDRFPQLRYTDAEHTLIELAGAVRDAHAELARLSPGAELWIYDKDRGEQVRTDAATYWSAELARREQALSDAATAAAAENRCEETT